METVGVNRATRGHGSACLGCGTELPEAFLDLGRTPLANAFVRPEHAAHPDATYPLAIAFCGVCHLVQLTDIVPPESLFSDYPYFSSYSDTFIAHAQAMAASLVQRFGLNAATRVLEIASNDGFLLHCFQRRGIPVLGVEPASNVAASAVRRGVPTVARFFGAGLVDDILTTFGAAQLIIGCNVLAHVPPINDFLRAVLACLTSDGVAVFEFPSLRDLLDRVEFDTIYHEHVFYYSVSAIVPLAARAGLELFDVEQQTVHGGSLRVFLQRPGCRPVSAAVGAMLASEVDAGLTTPERYVAFSHKVAASRRELLETLRALKASGKRLAAYGAPAKGNTLLNACGIGCDLVEFTVDRSPYKQGLLTPGARLPIRPPDELVRELPDYTVILPWNLADEILAQQREYLDRGGRFIIPIPSPREAQP